MRDYSAHVASFNDPLAASGMARADKHAVGHNRKDVRAHYTEHPCREEAARSPFARVTALRARCLAGTVERNRKAAPGSSV